MSKQPNPLADPDNWDIIWSEVKGELLWAYTGPETQPWLVAQKLEKEES